MHSESEDEGDFPFNVESSKEYGRYLVAKRNIRQWDLILTERPIVFGPMDRSNGEVTCLGCLAILKEVDELHYKCSICKWPVCSLECEKMQSHADYECRIFASHSVNFTTSACYNHIHVLRCLLLKETSPKKWMEIIALQSHVESRLETHCGMRKSLACTEFIREICKLEQFGQTEIDHVLGAISTNAFEGENWEQETQKIGAYLYTLASKAAHNCVPNTYRLIDAKSMFQLRACVDIPIGSSITTFYTDTWVPTQDRQEDLWSNYHFKCSCKRCTDQTELGTFFSGIKCTELNCPGYLIPEVTNNLADVNDNFEDTETDSRTESKFECTKCDLKINYDKVHDFISEFDDAISTVDEEYSLENMQSLNAIAKIYEDKVHRNHYKLLDLEYDIADRIHNILVTNLLSQLGEQKIILNRMLNIVKHLLEVLDIVRPGFSIFRGKILHILQYGLMIKLLQNSGIENWEVELEMRKIEDIRNIVIKILSVEPGEDMKLIVDNLKAESVSEFRTGRLELGI